MWKSKVHSFFSYYSCITCLILPFNSTWYRCQVLFIENFIFFVLVGKSSVLGETNLISCFTGPTDPKIWKIEIKIEQNFGSPCFYFLCCWPLLSEKFCSIFKSLSFGYLMFHFIIESSFLYAPFALFTLLPRFCQVLPIIFEFCDQNLTFISKTGLSWLSPKIEWFALKFCL